MSDSHDTPGVNTVESSASGTPTSTQEEPDTSHGRNPSSSRSTNRNTNRQNFTQATTPRDYEGATPKIGGILALRSENVNKKVNYDSFCEKLAIYIMNEFKGGENVIEIARNPSADIIANFETDKNP